MTRYSLNISLPLPISRTTYHNVQIYCSIVQVFSWTYLVFLFIRTQGWIEHPPGCAPGVPRFARSMGQERHAVSFLDQFEVWSATSGLEHSASAWSALFGGGVQTSADAQQVRLRPRLPGTLAWCDPRRLASCDAARLYTAQESLYETDERLKIAVFCPH